MYLRTDYTFNPTAKTITFTNPISLEGLLKIVNVVSGTVIYDVEGDYSRGTLVGNVLTLTEDTTGMGSEDVLSVQMADGSVSEGLGGEATLAEQQIQTSLLDLIKQNTTGLVKNDKEIPFIWFLVKQAFTDVTVDDIVVCYSIINTETGVGASYTKRWRGWVDVTVPSPITDYLVPTGGMPLTFAQLQSLGLATSAKQEELIATQYIDPVQVRTIDTSGTSQVVTVDSTAKMVALTTSKACWFKVEKDILASEPVATVGGAGCIQLRDDQTYYPVKVGSGTRIAVIQDSAAGKCTIVESA